MLTTTIRIIRLLVGLIAAWQVVGLLPVLTSWLPNIHSVTGPMWAVAAVKLLILLLCAAIYFWLGTTKDQAEDKGPQRRTLIVATLTLVSAGIIFAVAIPLLKGGEASTASAVSTAAPPPVAVPQSTAPLYSKPPTVDSVGWTEESTGSTVAGPWLHYDPPGTRYYRDAKLVIYRVYPPGVRPDAAKANPFGLMESTDRPPQ